MSISARPIVVGIDGSTAALHAARWAAAVARAFGAPLELVNGTAGSGYPLVDAAQAIRAAVAAAHAENSAAMLKSTEEQLRSEFPDVDVVTLDSDEPINVLLSARSCSARLIVLGSQVLSPTTALLVGSTTLSVMARAECPVVAWRGDSGAPSDKPVILGIDGPQTGSVAIQSSFRFAKRFGVELHVVHAWSSIRTPAGLIEPLMADWDGYETLLWQELMAILEPWTKLYPDVEVTYFVEREGSGEALLRHAVDAQLVVVGQRHTTLPGLFLGSTSLNLLHHSPVPVMTCHTPKIIADREG